MYMAVMHQELGINTNRMIRSSYVELFYVDCHRVELWKPL